MKSIRLSILVISLLVRAAYSPVQAAGITIDGNMSDWQNIKYAVNDSSTDVPGMNLIGAQLNNDSIFLYIRMIYANAYAFPLLWGNVTVQNAAGDVYVLMAVVTSYNQPSNQNDTWVFPGTDLNSPYNSRENLTDYTEHPGFAAVSPDNASIEFKIPFTDIDSGNASNLSVLYFVFWQYDVFAQGLTLHQTGMDRAPDIGNVTYIPSIESQAGSSSGSSSSTSTSSTSSSVSTSTSSTTSLTNTTAPTQSSSTSNTNFTGYVVATGFIALFGYAKKRKTASN